MKKLLLWLFMPFCFAACTSKKSATTADLGPLLRRLLAEGEIKKDSLLLIGPQYKWPAGKDTTGFADYLRLNEQIADSFYYWRKNHNGAVFSSNILENEHISGRNIPEKILYTALYRRTEAAYEHKYNAPVVNAFERCYAAQLKNPVLDSLYFFNVLQFLGISYNALGEKEKAISYYNKAWNYYLPAGNINKMASALINKCSYFNEYRQYDSVIRCVPPMLARSGIRPKRIANLKAYYAEALYEAGYPDYMNPLQEAWDSLQHTSAGSDELAKKADILKIQGHIALARRKYDAALSFLQQALDTTFKKENSNTYTRDYAKILLRIAAVFDSTRQYDSALRYCQYALSRVTPADSGNIASNPAMKDLYTENTIMEALDAKAALLQKKHGAGGNTSLLENAVDCYRLAFAVERKLTDNFTYDTSRAAVQRQSKMRSSAAIQTCWHLHNLTGSAVWAERAFEFSENSKALLLLEAVKKNIAANTSLKDNPLLKKADSLKLQYAFAEKQLLENKNAVLQAALQNRVDLLKNAVDNALTELETANLYNTNFEQQADILPQVKTRLLNSGSCLAEFFCSAGSNYLFTVSRSGQVGFYQLDSSVTELVDSFAHFFDAPGTISSNQAAYRQLAYSLYQRMQLQQVPAAADELLLIPDGPLCRLPFEALLTGPGSAGSLKNCPYLLNRFPVSYGYSAASLLRMQDAPGTNGESFAFAPGFSGTNRGLPALANSTEEAAATGAKVIDTGSNATVGNFRRSLSTASTIHLATHAGFDSSGTMPQLELADSAFIMSELYARRISAQLVMLNACQTHRGKIDESEGALSLARGFCYAGAANVVASLWNVEDRSSAKIARSFYQASHADKQHYGRALHDAKKALLNDLSGNYASPYYWAALVHIGCRKNNNPASSFTAGYGFAAAGILLLAVLLWRRYRRTKKTGS